MRNLVFKSEISRRLRLLEMTRRGGVSILERVSSLFFPPECETCGSIVSPDSASGVCASCVLEIKFLEPPFCETCGRNTRQNGPQCVECLDKSFYFDRAFSCALYEGKMKALIHAYKFEGRKILRNFFSEALLRFIDRHLKIFTWNAVAAVPLDSEKKRSRGFNQSEFLSHSAAAALKVEDLSQGIRRKKSAHPQSLLGKNERRLNVKDCFFASPGCNFSSKRILLIDDILTTGQTASECARSLKIAGASSVIVLTLARGA